MSKLFGLGVGPPHSNQHSQHHGGNCGYNNADGSNNSSNKGAIRNILVHIAGNRASWEHMGIHGALWRINPEKAGLIFNYDLEMGCTSSSMMMSSEQALQERVSRALIKKITVVESHTNIDEVIGVSIDGLPSKEFTANGDGASLFLLGNGKVNFANLGSV